MAILERTTRNIDNRCWNPGSDYFPVKNRYTAGVAGQRFFSELKENGKLLGALCNKCSITYVPARIYCERCFARLDDWNNVGLEGSVYAFTLMHKNKSGENLDKPILFAAVRIADGLIVHKLEDCSASEVWIGMPVKAELKGIDDRQGGLTDIICFKPL